MQDNNVLEKFKAWNMRDLHYTHLSLTRSAQYFDVCTLFSSQSNGNCSKAPIKHDLDYERCQCQCQLFAQIKQLHECHWCEDYNRTTRHGTMAENRVTGGRPNIVNYIMPCHAKPDRFLLLLYGGD